MMSMLFSLALKLYIIDINHSSRQRKSILRERMNANGSGEAEADSSAPEEDDKEVNLDNFMTLDSVGDVDGT